MPSYRIGPADFFTGGDLAADARTLDGQVQLLDGLVQNIPNSDKTISSSVYDAWFAFEAEWSFYYADNYATSGAIGNFLHALNDSSRDQLIQYEERFEDFVKKFAAAGYDTSAIDVDVSFGSPSALLHAANDALKKLAPWGFGIGGLLVLVLLVWYFVIR